MPENSIPDQATSDEIGSLATNFETEDELSNVPPMGRSRTIEEVDFRATFGDEKKVIPDANLAPRRHNVLFALLFFCFFVAAMALKHQQGRIMPADYDPCHFGSSQKRHTAEAELGQDGLPRKDLLNNCQDLDIWPESLQPSITPPYASFPTVNSEKKARWAAMYTNISATIPTISAPTMAPVDVPAPNTTCSTEGQFMCDGSDYFGLCAHGVVVWQHVSNGTQCKEDQIVGTSVPTCAATDRASLTSYDNGLGSATAWGPPDTFAVSTATMLSSDISTFQTMAYTTASASVYRSDTGGDLQRLDQSEGYKGDCHPQGDRRVGEPDMCFCYNDGTKTASDNVKHAINFACKYFENNSLGPAPSPGMEYKQVLVSNYVYKDGKKKSRILIKLQYWADVNGNDIRQGGPCLIFRRTWAQCVTAYQSLLDQCTHFAQKGGLKYRGGYGMDSCAMWTIDLNPSVRNRRQFIYDESPILLLTRFLKKTNKRILESIDGNYNFFLFEDPARNSKSKVSSATVTWPSPTYPKVPISIPGLPTSTTST